MRKQRILAVFACLLLCLSMTGCGTQPVPIEEPEKDDPVKEPIIIRPQGTAATLLFAGDTLLHNPQLKDALAVGGGKTYDFSACLQYAAPIVAKADYAIVNLETTFCDSREFGGYPSFNSPPSYAEELHAIGFDMCTTANNHSWDTGFDGVVDTLNHLDSIGLDHIGSYRSQEEFDKNMGVVVKTINGIKIAFLDYTYGLNGHSKSGKDFAVNVFTKDYTTTISDVDYDKLDKEMAYAHTLGADCIIVLIHWGVEYQTKENSLQDKLADYFISKGALAVIGGHSHNPQPLTSRTVTLADGSTRTGFVCFSLGNFTSNQIYYSGTTDFKHSDETALLSLDLYLNYQTDEVIVDNVSYVPFLMWRLGEGTTPRYYLLNCHDMLAQVEAGTAPSFVSNSCINRMKQCITDCMKIFGVGYDQQILAEGESEKAA